MIELNGEKIKSSFDELAGLTNSHTQGIMKIIKMNSYYCYLINRVEDIKCPCINHETKQPNADCKICLGTGNKIIITKMFCASQETKLPTTFRSDNFIVVRNFFIPKQYEVKNNDLIIDKTGVFSIFEFQRMFSFEGTIPYTKATAGKKKFDSKIFRKNFEEIIGEKI